MSLLSQGSGVLGDMGVRLLCRLEGVVGVTPEEILAGDEGGMLEPVLGLRTGRAAGTTWGDFFNSAAAAAASSALDPSVGPAAAAASASRFLSDTASSDRAASRSIAAAGAGAGFSSAFLESVSETNMTSSLSESPSSADVHVWLNSSADMEKDSVMMGITLVDPPLLHSGSFDRPGKPFTWDKSVPRLAMNLTPSICPALMSSSSMSERTRIILEL